MKLSIRHETLYQYSHPATYTIQLLRITPRLDRHQRVLEWALDTPGRRNRHVDAYGNISHTLVLDQPHTELKVVAHGVVELLPLSNGRLEEDADGHRQALPPEVFAVPTPLTQADDDVRAFAHQNLPRGLRNPSDALVLAQAICDQLVYHSGYTNSASKAADALRLGRGVCQDHAQLFLAVSRLLQVPARYVSGYIPAGDSANAASHAWADVWFAESGWISLDITNREFTSQSHCRIAVGRDYEAASPVRGTRVGGGDEHMQVHVHVAHLQQ